MVSSNFIFETGITNPYNYNYRDRLIYFYCTSDIFSWHRLLLSKAKSRSIAGRRSFHRSVILFSEPPQFSMQSAYSFRSAAAEGEVFLNSDFFF